ncbi:hypothetical protein E2C01_065924 [Portunus trituberculatus]|uniref:Uncharacterized protein n=1 Tax=Portunus trituberculatus TaxID=210409 RepID=A0A5B7HGW8_PORTR|nr:hypothetical protein [Portunus trituberculatus]
MAKTNKGKHQGEQRGEAGDGEEGKHKKRERLQDVGRKGFVEEGRKRRVGGVEGTDGGGGWNYETHIDQRECVQAPVEKLMYRARPAELKV